jgi:hypothetical protein
MFRLIFDLHRNGFPISAIIRPFVGRPQTLLLKSCELSFVLNQTSSPRSAQPHPTFHSHFLSESPSKSRTKPPRIKQLPKGASAYHPADLELSRILEEQSDFEVRESKPSCPKAAHNWWGKIANCPERRANETLIC